jgi:SulP family sulfate permease
VTCGSPQSCSQSFHDSDRELVGQGLGNVVAGLLGALPGAGSTFRTMANIRGGGKTPLSAVFHAAVLLALLLALGRYIRFIPTSVLAGILIYIGLGIVDWRYIRRFAAMPKTGVVIMVTTWLVALFVNVVTGAALGIVMASLVFVKHMADLQLDQLAVVGRKGLAGLSETEAKALEGSDGKTLLVRLGGPLAFGAATGLSRRLADLTNYDALVLDFSAVPDIDESGVVAFENIVRAARENGQEVLIAGLSRPVVEPILRFGLLRLLKSCLRFRRRLDALRAAAKIVQTANAAHHSEN